MDQNYLLTMKTPNGGTDFLWFETEEDLREYVSAYHIQVIDAIHILGLEVISL